MRFKTFLAFVGPSLLLMLFFIAAPLVEIIRLLREHSLYDGHALFFIVVFMLVLARLGALAFKRLKGMFYWEQKLK